MTSRAAGPLLSLLLLLGGIATAQQYPIVAIKVAGTQVYEPDEVIAYSGLHVDPNMAVSLASVREAAEKLVRSGVFAQVDYQHTAERGGMTITFQLQDQPEEQFLPARFPNIVWFEPAQLQAELEKRIRLFNGEVPLAGTLADEVARELESLLRARDVTAHISFRQQAARGTEEAAMVFVAENVNIVVARLQFPGASPAFAAELQAASAGLVGSTYNPQAIHDLIEHSWLDIYLKRGYLRAHFDPPKPIVIANQPGETQTAVVAAVKEGRLYNFQALRWAGNKALPAAQLQRLVHLYPGLSVNGALLREDLRAIRAEYARRGYLHMTLRAQPIYDESQDAVRYEFEVQEGPLFKLGHFEVSNADEKLAERIRNLWKLREGEPFDDSYVQTFRASLTALGNASRQFMIEESEGETAETIDITVVECRPGACHSSTNLYSPDAAPQDAPRHP